MFKSKYLNKSINLNQIYENNAKDEYMTESDTDSESETNTGFEFIIDVKPENPLNQTKTNEKLIFDSELKPKNAIKGYLEEKSAEESQQLLSEMSIKSLSEELAQKSVIKPGFEQNYAIKPFRMSKRMRKKLNKEEKSKTLGKKWFDMPYNELSEDKSSDLLALSMRRGWDPKRFYKKNESKQMPKYFQIGTVVETAADYYHSRVPKKDRKRTLVEELMADAQLRRYSKKKYSEALAQNPYYLKMKRRKEKQKLKEKGIDFKKNKTNKKKFNKRNESNAE